LPDAGGLRLARLSGDDLRVGARFLGALPRFLRTPFTIEQAAAVVRRRFDERATRLLARVRESCAVPSSPYAKLLGHAGCAPDDLATLVRRDGIEDALHTLFRAGVYLTGDEFKGRRPVVRGSLTFTINPATLINPRAVVHGLSESSGSRGARTPVPIDLAFIRDHAINTHLTLDVHGGRDWTHAHYGVPGGTSVTNPLELAKGGRPPARWFTPVDLATPGLSARYRLGAKAMRAGSILAGVPLPGPTHAPLDDPMPIVHWLASVVHSGGIPHVWGFSSSALLVCQAAADAGIDITGARFTAGGEPTTAARRRAIESTGAIVLPRMGATETDILSYACASPEAPDDMHFFEDRHVLIQPGAESAGAGRGGWSGDAHARASRTAELADTHRVQEAAGDSHAPAGHRDGPARLPGKAMLLTSLLPSAPVFLLNVCMGDQAELTRRSCGCGMERHGWTLHIHTVRSFEKLTAGGITLLDVDVVRVLEEVLPARFGGAPTDYQLLEQLDDARARPEVRLLVSPALGPLDASDVANAFLDAIGGGDSGERLMELQWRGGGVLRVVREPPRRTASGKILHLFLERG